MRVVLDANALIEDRFLERPHTDLLLRERMRGRLKLIVPEVVVVEVINDYNRTRDSGANLRSSHQPGQPMHTSWDTTCTAALAAGSQSKRHAANG
jgi:hypothetical protein